MVQNKLHYAVHQHTAAEVIAERADHRKEHMGLTSWKNAPTGKIVKADVSIEKNYLTSEELGGFKPVFIIFVCFGGRRDNLC